MPRYRVTGRVTDDAGAPVAGALVMGVDLGWAETAEDGSFTVHNPEMALFVWCTGFYPCAHVLRRHDKSDLELTLRTIRLKPAVAPESLS